MFAFPAGTGNTQKPKTNKQKLNKGDIMKLSVDAATHKE